MRNETDLLAAVVINPSQELQDAVENDNLTQGELDEDGRPVLLEFSREELERMFKRVL